MTFDVAYLRKTLKDILAELLTGVVVNGGTVDVAVANNQNTYLQQWMSLELGSASAVSMNLMGSMLEPFNLYASTTFYVGNTVANFAVNDVTMAQVAGTSTYLPGFISPAHLKLAAHFQGTGNVPNSVVAADAPVYNSNTTNLAKLALANSQILTPPAILVAGTPAASTVGPVSGAVSNAFDGNVSTFWCSRVPNLLPTGDGVPSALDANVTAINAFDGKAATSWDTGIINGYSRFPGTVTGSHAGTPSNAFNASGYSLGTNGYMKWDMGVGNALTISKYSYTADASTRTLKSFILAGSNDDITYTTVDTRTGVSQTAGTYTFACASPGRYRYYRMTATDYWYVEAICFNLIMYVNLTLAPTQLNYDLGLGQSLVGTGYTVSSTGSNTPKSWLFQGSNDNAAWTTLETVSGYAGSFPYTGTVSNVTAYRYYRLSISASSHADQAQVAITDFKVTGEGAVSPYLASNPQTLSYDLGAGALPKVITRYSVNSSVYMPTDWLLQGSNNNTDWTTLDTVAAYASTFPVVRSFANTVPYRYHRMLITGATGNNDVVRILELSADNLPVITAYDTTDKVFGSSSAKLMYYYQKGTAVQNINHLKLSNNDFCFSGMFKFQAGFPFPQTLFAILGKQIEIQATATGLAVNYSVDGTNMITVNSTSYPFSYDTWYWIAVGRTGNTLTFSAGPAVGAISTIGTADLTGVTLFATASNNFYLGADSTGANPFIGHMQEVELFTGENPAVVKPVAVRSAAYVPAINWVSAVSYVPSLITKMSVMFFLDEKTFLSFGVPTVGTDLVFSVSLDNGANWHVVPLTKNAFLTSNTAIYKGDLDVTAVTNTNQLIYKIVSAAGKVVKYDGAVISWS